MVHLIFIAATFFCCSQIQSSTNQLLQISNVPLAVGVGYMTYNIYRSYCNEDKKMNFVQKAVDSLNTLEHYSRKNDETSLNITHFLNNNKDNIERLNKQTTDGFASKKFILNKLKKSENKELRDAVAELKLEDDSNARSLIEIVATGQHALLQKAQKILLGDSIPDFIGRKMYNFKHSHSGEKANTVENALIIAVFLPIIIVTVTRVCLPLFFACEGIKNIDLGIKIDKKYRNGVFGLLLERYAVKNKNN